MAPKASKSSNKGKKSTNWVDNSIQGTTLVLSLVVEAAKYAPFPYLNQAAGTTLKIINTIQVCISGSCDDFSTAQFLKSVKDHKAQFRRLGDDVAKIIAGIWESYQEVPEEEKVDWPPVELRDVIRDLVS